MIFLPQPSSWRAHLRQACAGLALLTCAGTLPAHAQDVPPSAPPQKNDTTEEAAPQPVNKNQAADQDAQKDDSQNLNEITVHGHHDTLGESDKRLKALQNSLPCNGCDVKPRKKKFMRKVLDAVAERVLPTEAPDHSNYDPNDKTLEFSQEGSCITGGMNVVNSCVPSNANP